MADSASFTIIDNSDKILAELEEQVLRALEACGQQAEAYAKLLAPVDTGLLRNSITHAIDGESAPIRSYHADRGSNGKSASDKGAGSVGFGVYSGKAPQDKHGHRAVYIGTNVKYGIYQEMGTKRSKAQPFLRPAIADHAGDYRTIIENTLKSD